MKNPISQSDRVWIAILIALVVALALAFIVYVEGADGSRSVHDRPTELHGRSEAPSFPNASDRGEVVSAVSSSDSAAETEPSGEVPSYSPTPHYQKPSLGDSPFQAYQKEHPNNPARWIPATARSVDLGYFQQEADQIIRDWQERRDELLKRHGDDLVGFSQDPETLGNDSDRQQKLKNLVLSIWPDSGPKEHP